MIQQGSGYQGGLHRGGDLQAVFDKRYVTGRQTKQEGHVLLIKVLLISHKPRAQTGDSQEGSLEG